MGMLDKWFRWAGTTRVTYPDRGSVEHFIVLACHLPRPSIFGIFSRSRFTKLHTYVDYQLVQQNGANTMTVNQLAGWYANYQFPASSPEMWLGWRFHWSMSSGPPRAEAWLFQRDPGEFFENVGSWTGADQQGQEIYLKEGSHPYREDGPGG